MGSDGAGRLLSRCGYCGTEFEVWLTLLERFRYYLEVFDGAFASLIHINPLSYSLVLVGGSFSLHRGRQIDALRGHFMINKQALPCGKLSLHSDWPF